MRAPRYTGAFSSKSGLSEPSSRYRQSLNRNSPNPVRSTRFRNCFGIIWSVSTFALSSGATTPVTFVNDSILIPLTPRRKLDTVVHLGQPQHTFEGWDAQFGLQLFAR